MSFFDEMETFFLWWMVFDAALLAFSTVFCLVAMDTIRRWHGRLFQIPDESVTVVIYGFLGLFKILFFVFNVGPWVALMILNS